MRYLQKNILIFACFLALSLLCTACGFRPRGEMKLAAPLHKLYLEAPDPYGQLVRSLKIYLRASKVQLVDKPEEASATLTILRDDTSETLVSVGGTQQTRQYTLHATAAFVISDAKGQIIVPPQTLEETRAITIQSSQILGSSNEANLYYQQMRNMLAYAIMNRISSREITNLFATDNVPVKPSTSKKR